MIIIEPNELYVNLEIANPIKNNILPIIILYKSLLDLSSTESISLRIPLSQAQALLSWLWLWVWLQEQSDLELSKHSDLLLQSFMIIPPLVSIILKKYTITTNKLINKKN